MTFFSGNGLIAPIVRPASRPGSRRSPGVWVAETDKTVASSTRAASESLKRVFKVSGTSVPAPPISRGKRVARQLPVRRLFGRHLLWISGNLKDAGRSLFTFPILLIGKTNGFATWRPHWTPVKDTGNSRHSAQKTCPRLAVAASYTSNEAGAYLDHAIWLTSICRLAVAVSGSRIGLRSQAVVNSWWSQRSIFGAGKKTAGGLFIWGDPSRLNLDKPRFAAASSTTAKFAYPRRKCCDADRTPKR